MFERNIYDFELAKQWKDAGFPQSYAGKLFIFPDGSKLDHWNEVKEMQAACYVPTLSELIEACGERVVFKLQWVSTKWLAENRGKVGFGSSPKKP